ncbi:hypothetical protein V495_02497 [Pseudogymnoascus sp. VKM F-4514 (FW-929)]|nr:hypothetical protein V495_02497 [Pseudogymnoascus sp. VKM F-4514 (FW-929)]KFY59831.1 hypothetical protein V497_04060 [Pseudogymnoascus sp. VKM F-4516 (FW-969)]
MLLSRVATATSLRLLLFAPAISETSAATCRPDSDEYVSNQEEVEAMFAGCTEIRGVVKLSRDYTGPLYLPNVTYISGGFGSVNSDDDHPFPAPLLTSINLPDLNNTYTIKITGASTLTAVSFPKLVLVNDSITLTGLPDCAVDFSALTETSSLLVSGNSTSLYFPSLVTAKSVRVTRDAGDLSYDTRSGKPYMNLDRVNLNSFDISFPELVNAVGIFLQGNIENLFMPRLSNISVIDGSYSWNAGEASYLQILTYGHHLDISLPSLSTIAFLSVSGTIGSISFPSLRNLSNFKVNATSPFDVDLEPIQFISEYMRLSGNITSVSLSSIKRIYSAIIESDTEGFDCDSVVSDLEEIRDNAVPYMNDHIMCSGPVHPPKSKMPLILGLSIGLGIPVLLGLAYYVYFMFKIYPRKRQEQASTNNKPPEYELGVPPTYTADGLPTYDASEEGGTSEQGAGGVAGARTGDGSSVRGEGTNEPGAGDGASARPEDGNSAHQEGGVERRLV